MVASCSVGGVQMSGYVKLVLVFLAAAVLFLPMVITDPSAAVGHSELENVIEASITEGNNSSNIRLPDGFRHGQ